MGLSLLGQDKGYTVSLLGTGSVRAPCSGCLRSAGGPHGRRRGGRRSRPIPSCPNHALHDASLPDPPLCGLPESQDPENIPFEKPMSSDSGAGVFPEFIYSVSRMHWSIFQASSTVGWRGGEQPGPALTSGRSRDDTCVTPSVRAAGETGKAGEGRTGQGQAEVIIFHEVVRQAPETQRK